MYAGTKSPKRGHGLVTDRPIPHVRRGPPGNSARARNRWSLRRRADTVEPPVRAGSAAGFESGLPPGRHGGTIGDQRVPAMLRARASIIPLASARCPQPVICLRIPPQRSQPPRSVARPLRAQPRSAANLACSGIPRHGLLPLPDGGIRTRPRERACKPAMGLDRICAPCRARPSGADQRPSPGVGPSPLPLLSQ